MNAKVVQYWSGQSPDTSRSAAFAYWKASVWVGQKTCSIGRLVAKPLSAFTFSVSVLNQQKNCFSISPTLAIRRQIGLHLPLIFAVVWVEEENKFDFVTFSAQPSSRPLAGLSTCSYHFVHRVILFVRLVVDKRSEVQSRNRRRHAKGRRSTTRRSTSL